MVKTCHHGNPNPILSFHSRVLWLPLPFTCVPNLTTLSIHFVFFFVVLHFSEVCQSQGGGESFCVKGDMLSVHLVIVLSVQGYSCRGHMEERWVVAIPA